MSEKYYLSTKEIIIISLISALGGTLSSFVSIIGRQTQIISAVSGMGQIVSGIHVFWLALLALLIQKPGVATFAGLIKGLVELFSGSPHGVTVVLVSLIQGLCIDAVFLTAHLLKFNKESLLTISFATIIASASNVLITRILIYSGLPLELLTFLFIVAGLSGMVFGGFFAYDTLQILREANLLDMHNLPEDYYQQEKTIYLRLKSVWKSTSNSIIGIMIVLIFIVGSSYTVSLIT